MASGLRAVAIGTAIVLVAGCSSGAGRHATPTTTEPAPARTSTETVGSHLSLAPSPRIGAGMAFDPLTKSVVLFGGLGVYGTTADTWSWNGEQWTALAPAAASTSRLDAAMTYDPISRIVLMLGGEHLVPLTDPCRRPAGRAPQCTPGNRFRAVPLAAPFWGWDGDAWKPRRASRTTPDERASLVTQSDGTVLAFGNGTWTYDGRGWELGAPASVNLYNPVGIAVDPTTHQVIAVERFQPLPCTPSGCAKPSYMRTFTWTGSSWKELADRHTPLASGSIGGTEGSLIADPAGGGLLMFADDGSTWRRTNGDWRQVATLSQSPARLRSMTLVADPASREVVGFGGATSSPPGKSNATWIWNGTRWRELTAPRGQAPIPAPIAPAACRLIGGAPQVNQEANTDATVHVMSSNIFITLPCDLKVTFTFTLVGADGTRLPVPGNPSVVNVDTHTTVIGGGVVTITWLWTHACASARVRAEIKATGAGAGPNPNPSVVNLKPLPVCTGSGASTLSANPYRIT